MPTLVTLQMLWWASPSKFCQASYTLYGVNCHHGHDMASIISSTFMSNVEKSSCEFYWIAFSNLTIPATCGFVQGAGISSAWRLGRLSWSGSCQWPNCGLWMTVVSNIPTIIFIDISVVSPLHLKITRSWRETHFLSELKLFETTERALFCKLSAPVVSWTISSENGSLRGRPVRHGEKKNGRCLSRLHVCIWRCWKGFVQPTGWHLLVYYVYFPKQINPFQRGFQGFSIHIPEPLTLLTKQLFTHCLCACLAWKDQCWQENAGCFMSGNLAAFIFFLHKSPKNASNSAMLHVFVPNMSYFWVRGLVKGLKTLDSAEFQMGFTRQADGLIWLDWEKRESHKGLKNEDWEHSDSETFLFFAQ